MISRIEEIRKLLFTNKKVLVNDLSAQFDVSRVSIRKDLQQLEDEALPSAFTVVQCSPIMLCLLPYLM